MIGPLLFSPLYQERVWGGRSFAEAMGRELPDGKLIGESWEIVDRPKEQSVVARGPQAGRSLRQLMTGAAETIMGTSWPTEQPFPILVKWLDCQERLSLQVHPPASVAPALGGEPKTENWYVAGASAGASLIVGLKRGGTREQFEKSIAANTLEELLHRFPVSAGDSILVESGRLHAIDAGNLILEIQQNSDTTYRVYDWGRVGLDGKPRQLHVEQSLRCIDFEDFEPQPLHPAGRDEVLADCREFRIQRFVRRADETIKLAGAKPQARLLHVVTGAVEVSWGEGDEAFQAGDNILFPADGDYLVRAVAETTLLLTDRFSGN